MKLRLLTFSIWAFVLCNSMYAQTFPNPATLSTGQGPIGTFDPIWMVSDYFLTFPPNPLSGVAYTPAIINNNCAPGSWVNPAALPPPVNNGNWISNPGYSCSDPYDEGWVYFRLTINLPADCNGNSVATNGNYVLYFSGYVDNVVTDVFVNGTSTGISGGSFSTGTQCNITLTGPWQAGINYVDVLVNNFDGGGAGNPNPYGLLMVANSTASTIADGDGDGTPDIDDLCPCTGGLDPNGCPVTYLNNSGICSGQSATLTPPQTGTYLWNDGSTNNSLVVSPVATSSYSVTVTEASGIQSINNYNITVHALPVAGIAPVASICTGTSTTLVASGGPGYSWSTGGITSSITVSPTVTTPYSVTVTDANNCTATATTSVTVNSLPVAGINPVAAICAGASATLTATGGASYIWSNAANTASTTVYPVTPTTYSVTVTDANTCSATATATVAVNPLPNASINPASASICNGSSVLLTAAGGTNYVWSTGANTSGITVSPVTNTPYTVTVSDANNCTATATTTVNVYAATVASIIPVAPICTGTSAILTASGGTSYSWNTGAGTSSITVSPTATTPYSVTVTDANNCTATATTTVTVNSLPLAGINPVSPICLGESATLTATGGTNYAWSNAANTAAITVSPTSPANYSVTVTDANSCSATATTTLTVHPLPLAAINPASSSICTGNSILLTASGGTSYEWSNTSNTPNVTVSPVSNTSYTVTVTDANNCTATATGAVSIHPVTIAGIAPAAPVCKGTSATLTASGGTSYLWSSGENTAALTVAPAATTQYSVTVTDANACTATAASTVTIYELPALSLVAEDITCFGAGNGTVTTNVSNGQVPFQYSIDGAPFQSSGVFPNLNAGTYTIRVTDLNGCSDIATQDITEPSMLTLSASWDIICSPGSAQMQATADGGVLPYQYSMDNGNLQTTGIFEIADGQNHTVSVSDANGCTASVIGAMTMSELAIEISPLLDTLIFGKSIELQSKLISSNDPPLTYIWEPADGLSCSDCPSPVAQPLISTVYTLKVPNAIGCVASATASLYVENEHTIYIPNAFTPNGNTKNDLFYIYGYGIKTLDLKVYDRWGEMVFQTTNPAQGWDGTKNGKLLTPDVFVYVADIVFLDDIKDQKKGSLMLMK